MQSFTALKVDEGHWWRHSSTRHISVSICGLE